MGRGTLGITAFFMGTPGIPMCPPMGGGGGMGGAPVCMQREGNIQEGHVWDTGSPKGIGGGGGISDPSSMMGGGGGATGITGASGTSPGSVGVS